MAHIIFAICTAFFYLQHQMMKMSPELLLFKVGCADSITVTGTDSLKIISTESEFSILSSIPAQFSLFHVALMSLEKACIHLYLAIA